MVDPQSTPHQSLARRAAGGAAWIAAEMFAVQGASLLVFGVIARFVSPSEFGIISICIVILHTTKSLLIDNFGYAVIRKPEADHLEYTTAFWMTIAFSLLSFLVLEATADLLQRMFEISGFATTMREMAIVILIMGLARTHECWMFRHFQFRLLAIRSIAAAIAGGGVGIALAARGYGIEALVAQQVVTYLTALVALWGACPWKPVFSISKSAAGEIFRFVGQTTPGGFLGILSQNCDTLLVAYFFGPANTGLYSVAKRLRLAMQLVASAPINGIALPTLADAQREPERLRRVLSQANGIVCAVCAPLFLGVAAVADDVITLLFGSRWAAAAPILQWLAAGGVAAALLACNDAVFAVRGRPIWTFYVSAAYTILAVLGFVGLYRLGNAYLAAPFVLPYVVTLPFSAWLCSRVTTVSFSDWLLRVLPALASAIIMLIAVRLLGGILSGPGPIARLAILCPFGAVIYVGALAIFDRSTLRKITETVGEILLSRSAHAKLIGEPPANV
ncbi:oligosaccharide flippase family protein [Bradyrhizobium sp. NP1]|uniref:oligosaccharide flippase family protein n=1 Tax=Bradyrhizobium sp. NP1 TaxID=3049772 RepID=UPI0033966F4D